MARNNLERAGLAARVDLRVGPALETLSQIETAGFAPFDLIFIDPDKANNAHYLVWALQLARLGSVIIGDNVIRNGAVPDVGSSDASVQGIRRFFDKRPAKPRLSATALQTVGDMGWDGFTLATVYFGSIPHAELLKSVTRRIVDRRVMHLIKMWLECPVEETD